MRNSFTRTRLQDAAEFRRLENEIAECCAAHVGSATAKEGEASGADSVPVETGNEPKPETHSVISAVEQLVSRKTSLTCTSPPSEKLLVLPLIRTDEENEFRTEQDQQRTPRKLRSPLPSPSPSPLPSPSGRFKVNN